MPLIHSLKVLSFFSFWPTYLMHHFYMPVFRRDVLWYGDVRPSFRPSVPPSRAPSVSFPHLSPTCFDIFSWNFAYDFVLMYYRSRSLSLCNNFYTPVFRRDVLWYGDVRPSVRPSGSPSVRPSVRPSQFSALFSYMLWHIFLKFCVSLYFYARKIKFECHQFPSLFAGVMLLFNFKLLQICSFPHFSPTSFDIHRMNHHL